ncbi:DUF485 domain-containing protein [Kitasatospora herbaricolor]|uniref:DUF485 domain-containing protein n=1 Tax=Kitasatospora herbaricolor TaxID=68217 RepID=A0ABZ1WGF4_9ACTN|nr:DUF485 domain-containing protein [Kitasatospora herbaricolor]
METPSTVRQGEPDRLEHLERSEDFRRLRSSFRGFAFPVTAGFLLWYLLYVLLSNYAPDFMATRLFGHVNVALALGLLQFVSTFTIAALYARYADRRLDPRAAFIREGRTVGAPTEPGRAAS